MPGWSEWLLLGLAGWFIVVVAGVVLSRLLRLSGAAHAPPATRTPGVVGRQPASTRRRNGDCPRILVVDDDPSLRALLVATLAGQSESVVEAETAQQARECAAALRPDVVVLDVSLPDANGLVFCAELQELDEPPRVVLLTGTDVTDAAARSAGADAVLRKPFSPLELLALIERVTGSAVATAGAPRLPGPRDVLEGAEQLFLYARDLAQVIEIERAQRRLIESAYRQTVSALASALEARDTGTNVHSLRVTRYALELAGHTAPELLDDPSIAYGFLLHDIGKIGVADGILLKQGPLDAFERREMQQHPVIGELILRDIAILQGEGLAVVRSHHEHWNGRGYPDGLAEQTIPRGARIFAVADALDALTSDRPYRIARDWATALDEIAREGGRQFDPDVVGALLREEASFRAIQEELVQAA